MVCLYCMGETEVYNSRSKRRSATVWRRRRCKACVAQFTTLETPDLQTSLLIRHEGGTLKAFSRDRLFLSLYKSLGHRDNALDDATALTATVLAKILRGSVTESGILEATVLAKTSYSTLRRYDPLAAHTYKAYHQKALRRG